MPIKMKLTLGLLLLLAGAALADTNYKIREGDTLSKIAQRFGVKEKTLLRANRLKPTSTLRIGRSLVIPGVSARKSDASTKRVVPTEKSTYTVRRGDHDGIIAKRTGLTVKQLRALNPGVRWTRLQPGQKVVIARKAAIVRKPQPAATPKPNGEARQYVVRRGDNDFLIARRLNTTPRVLRQLNPGVNWSRLQIGAKLNIPGGQPKVASNTLRTRHAIVTGDRVMVRKAPRTTASAVTRVDSGARAVVLDRDENWYKLRFTHGTTGWVRGDFLKSASAATVASAKPAARPLPPVVQLPSVDDEVAEISVEDEIGELTQQIVALQKQGGTVEKVLQKARSMRGVRYRWGAASRSSTDCSGFTSQVFKATGIKIPRTSAQQATVGKPVARKDLKPGDLVFFRTSRGRRISHVGIYVGNNKFIHASSGGGKVMESSLSEPFYNNRYVTARRLVSTQSKHVVSNKAASSKSASSGNASGTSDAAEISSAGDSERD